MSKASKALYNLKFELSLTDFEELEILIRDHILYEEDLNDREYRDEDDS